MFAKYSVGAQRAAPALVMFAKYSVGAQRAAPALARHLLCPKTTLYSAGINSLKRIDWLYPIFRDLHFYHGLLSNFSGDTGTCRSALFAHLLLTL